MPAKRDAPPTLNELREDAKFVLERLMQPRPAHRRVEHLELTVELMQELLADLRRRLRHERRQHVRFGPPPRGECQEVV